MKLSMDRAIGVAYIELIDGFVDHTVRLDQDRMIDYDAEGRVMGYEFLSIRRGVDLSDLPHREELARLFVDHDVRVLA
jgi:uncharacterized protein YuzE